MEDEVEQKENTGQDENTPIEEPEQTEQEENIEVPKDLEDTAKKTDLVKSNKTKNMIYAGIREILIYIAVVAICVFIIPRFIIQRTIVSGTSMENTLFNSDNLLVEKVSYHIVDPKRFDVVVFYPYGRNKVDYFVKRVIGLPGETIQIKGNDIYIDGKKIEENYGKDPITYQGIASEPLKLGEDEFFLMGDNRKVSYDSRYEDVGPVHRALIEGKALLRIWPLKDFGTFD